MKQGSVNVLKRPLSLHERSRDESIWKLCGNLLCNDVERVLLPELKLSEEKLPQVLKFFSEQKQGSLAFATLEAIRKNCTIQLKASHYTLGITSCARSNKSQLALRLLEVMPQAKVQPNIYSYSTAISACEKSRQWQQAMTLFEEMPNATVQPNDISYNAAISACEKGGQWHHC